MSAIATRPEAEQARDREARRAARRERASVVALMPSARATIS